jgi:hypothetical protein
MQASLQARNDSGALKTETARTSRQESMLVDNRPTALAQRKLAEMTNSSPRVLQQRALSDAIHNSPRMAAQRHKMNSLFGGAVRPQSDGKKLAELSPAQREEKPNKTGLPNQLKSGIESLSGMSMDHVKVHYNSDKPAQLQAHAYAQGSEIHLGAGQEKHLPHEAWHVVQQAQGRVRPTVQMKAGAVNDDPSLEKEADMMGERAAHPEGGQDARNLVSEERVAGVVTQRVGCLSPTQFFALPPSVRGTGGVIQRAATVNQIGGGNPMAGFRTLHGTEHERTIINYRQGTAIRDRISVFGLPGFGTNLGHIDGNGNALQGPNVGDVHTEPILIGRTYGAGQNNPNWNEANTAVDQANAMAGGAAARNHFDLFTERAPCYACGQDLANARYDNADTVSWRYTGTVENRTAEIAQSHIARAAAQFGGYIFVVDGNRPWRLSGFRIHSIVQPDIQPDRKDESGDDQHPPTKRQDLPVVRTGDLQVAGKAVGGSGTAHDPILVD